MTKHTILFAAAPLLVLTQPANAQDAPPEQVEIESALTPLVTFRGEEAARPSLEERMEQLGIANASVAVYRDGELEWARGYGEGIDPDTLFQAASLSKAVASAGIIALAMERGVSLDADISGELAGLDLELINPAGLPITLRQLLSHTNGAGVSGFPGYADGTDVPTTAQVVMGEEPTNTARVVISSERQGTFNYSGGGYTIAQHWAETVTGEPFPEIVDRLILEPLGMERSLFAALRRGDFPRENVALGYNGDGTEIPGGWNVYPEHAAASLWTTPREYGLFALGLMDALEGDPDAVLSEELVREMTRVVDDGYALGIGVSDMDGAVRLSHSGSNRGYKSNFMAYPATDSVIVTMTGADNGWPLMGDIGRTANVTYDWPTTPLIVRDRLPASEAEMEAFSGVYELQGNESIVVTIRPDENGELRITAPSGASWTMVRVGNASWIDPNDAQLITFEYREDGTLIASDGNQTFVRREAD
ncbi:serine hydrolase domain-containing protein [Aurantiacibacter sp. MUD61]|uniref:serine hydrolase domain-containing protein n=1 Tax=Aurantiacibacter sp. MUD61 TaxID=3009083 RepID=UPI0022F0E34C|nr:serine hydrolase domain-containing protein [Aurantiacibacter sp. MUD61]